MKKIYRILLGVFLGELAILVVLNRLNIVIQSFLGKTLVIACVLLPILILLHLVGKDDAISNGKRTFAKIVFWVLIACYVLAGFAELAMK